MQSSAFARVESTSAARFRSQRIFYHAFLHDGSAGWCFETRGGRVYGPFPSKDVAERILAGLVETFKRAGDSGGRSSTKESSGEQAIQHPARQAA
jgi:hypothetical protein